MDNDRLAILKDVIKSMEEELLKLENAKLEEFRFTNNELYDRSMQLKDTQVEILKAVNKQYEYFEKRNIDLDNDYGDDKIKLMSEEAEETLDNFVRVCDEINNKKDLLEDEAFGEFVDTRYDEEMKLQLSYTILRVKIHIMLLTNYLNSLGGI